MSQDWTEKYRPKTLSDVVGNPKAVNELKAWAESWNKGKPSKRAVVLSGSPGVGKTTSAEALANDMGWGIIEMNASDQRTGEAIKNTALRGAFTNTFDSDGSYLSTSEGGRKLIVLDEADSLFGNVDRGAMPVINELIKESKQPVILIVNDYYALSRKSSAVKNDAIQISFQKPTVISISKALKKIAVSEGISITDDAVKAIAENSSNDIRAAVRDLESLSLGRTEIVLADTENLTGRGVKKSTFDLMAKIFRQSDAMAARRFAWDIDDEPREIMLWVDDCLPKEFTSPGDLMRGFNVLSRADVFLGRVRRRQYYGFWSYAMDLMTAGICVSKLSDKRSSGWFRPPEYKTKLSRTKGIRATKAQICQKLSDYMHTSTNRASLDVLPSLKLILKRDPELRVTMIRDVGLEAEELAFLLNVKMDDKAVKEAIAAATPEPVQPVKAAKKEEVVVKTVEKPEPVVEKPAAKPKGQKSLFEF